MSDEDDTPSLRPVLPPGKWFHPSEFACHDAKRTPYPAAWLNRWLALRDLCDAIRDLWGGPLIVVSGYRTPEYNHGLIDGGSHGVASGSYHLTGDAGDLKTKRGAIDVPQLLRVVLTAYEDKKLPLLGGVGDYPESGWLHVDTHKPADGHLRRWRGR